MINYLVGNLFESKAEALVNTVNTQGVMGKGIALQFKKSYPSNYKIYRDQCKKGQFDVGQLIITHDQNLESGEKIIINFPTKTNWRLPSEYSYIERGLDALVEYINEHKIKSIAIPPLGSGNGGLQWGTVKLMIDEKLKHLTDCDVYVYEPNAHVKEILNKERVKLTPARGMLLYMLFQLVRNGEFVSEFSSEKLCYFLQRFGGKQHFKLTYSPNFYGPYSGKVKHVLNYLNGSYITGYGGKDSKPFEELSLLKEAEPQVLAYINENDELKSIVEQTSHFLEGFYSSFGLELLSTVDFISQKKNTLDSTVINAELEQWSERKKTLFSNKKYVDLSIDRLRSSSLHSK